MAHVNGQQKRCHKVDGQPKAKAAAAPERQLDLGDSLAQSTMADSMVEAEVYGQCEANGWATINAESKAETGPSANALHSIGILVSAFYTAICSRGLKSS